jgi:hypothetical protein
VIIRVLTWSWPARWSRKRKDRPGGRSGFVLFELAA